MFRVAILQLLQYNDTDVSAPTGYAGVVNSMCIALKSQNPTAKAGFCGTVNSCFLYIPETTPAVTFASAKSQCSSLTSQVSALGGTCMMAQLVDQATVNCMKTLNLFTVSVVITCGHYSRCAQYFGARPKNCLRSVSKYSIHLRSGSV